MDAEKRIIPPGVGTSQPFMPGERFTWKVTDGGSLDFAELLLDVGVGPPEHVHHANDEAYYILDGEFRFKVGEEIGEATAGAFVFIPRGVPHTWTNTGGRPGHVAVLFTPGGMSGYFTELEPMLPELMAGLPDMAGVDPDVLAKADDIMRRYGYELVGPPLS